MLRDTPYLWRRRLLGYIALVGQVPGRPNSLQRRIECRAVIDFQDAVYGPITYDLVSLLRDAYVGWEEDQVLDWSIRYWEIARREGSPARE